MEAANYAFNANDLTVGTLTTSTTGISDAAFYTYEPANTWYWLSWPYAQTIYRDRGEQALKIAKMLQDKKLVSLRTAKQFAELMDALLVVL